MNILQKINKNVPSSKKLLVVVLCVTIFSIVANAYCWFDFNFSHDSSIFIQNDCNWQVAIGRYLHPIYVMFRGQLFSPFIVGVLSILWLTVSAYFLTEILKIKKLYGIVLSTGILSANFVITLITATYIFELDVYMCSLMFSVLASYLCIKHDKLINLILSVLFFAISLGFYQSFWQVGIIIMMFSLIQDILISKLSNSEIIKKVLKYLLVLVFSIIVYYLGSKLALIYYNVQSANSYNSLSDISNLLNFKNLLSLIKGAYSYFINNTFHIGIYNAGLVNTTILISSLFTLLIMALNWFFDKANRKDGLILLLLVILIPLGGNIVYVISQGMEHGLMTYSFSIVYIFYIAMSENINFKNHKLKVMCNIYSVVILITCGVIIFNNIIYSNQLYMKKHVEYEYTYSIFNRIIDRAEQCSEYIVGETPVIFIGNLQNTKFASYKDYFDYSQVGISAPIAVTYISTYSNFINNVMSYPMKVIVDGSIIKSYDENQNVKNMDVYPAKNSIKMIDGNLVIKLSNNN